MNYRAALRQLIRKRLPLFWIAAIVGLIAPWLTMHSPLPPGAGTPPRDGAACTVVKVYDGDTITAHCPGGETVKVRYHCIDTPEMQQGDWGRESRDQLRALLPLHSAVEIIRHEVDRYGRVVGEVISAEGINTNLEQVRRGAAAVYRRYCSDGAYSAAEATAKREKIGIWREEGLHQTPWLWRRQKK